MTRLIPDFVAEHRRVGVEFLDDSRAVCMHRHTPKNDDRPDHIILSATIPYMCDTTFRLTPEQVVYLANTMLTDSERAHLTHPAQSRLAELQAETDAIADGITEAVRDISDSLDRQTQRDRDLTSPLRQSTVLASTTDGEAR